MNQYLHVVSPMKNLQTFLRSHVTADVKIHSQSTERAVQQVTGPGFITSRL